MKIKRPLFIVALSMLVAIYMVNSMSGSMLLICLALFVLFIAVHKLTQDRYTHHLALFLLTALVAVGWLGVYKYNLNNKIEYLKSKETFDLTGVVTKSENVGYTNRYDIKILAVDDTKINGFKVQLYSDERLKPGDSIKSSAKFKSFTPKSNYLSFYSDSIFGRIESKNIEVVPGSNITAFFFQIRTKLIGNSRKIFDYKAVPVAVAMGLGDKTILDPSIVNAFNFTGLSHALVVSGLHVGFIVAVFNALLYLIPVNKKLKNIVLLIAVFSFMGIIGFTPSIIRAGVLVIALTVGKTFILETDNYTTLAIVIILTLFFNPFSAHSGSLLLSYAAYFGVIQAADIARNKKLNKLLTIFLLSSFAVLYTTPILALLGMEFTFLSPFFNVLMTYVVMAICVLSFFLPVLGCVPAIGMPVAAVIAPINNILISFLLWFTEFAKEYFAFAMISVSADVTKIFIFSAVIAIAIAFIQFTDNKKRIICILTVPIMAVLCYNFTNRDVVTVSAFDGSSNPSYVITENDKHYLIATENINSGRFESVKQQLEIENFDEIIICAKVKPDIDFYFNHTENLKIADKTGEYIVGDVTVYCNIKNRQIQCVADVYGTTIGFNHNKADLSDLGLDFYFFGADTPRNVDADNYFYFYPVNKKNVDLVTEKQAVELYDIIEIKIRKTNGEYSIIEDVKNFGSRI